MSGIKDNLKIERESISVPIIRFDANASESIVAKAPPVYQKVINDAKKYMNMAGALYIASEVMPFDIPSENYKRVKYDAEAKKFLKTFTNPQPIPVIYNHNDGTDPWMSMEGKPDVAGRVLSNAVADGVYGVPTVFCGQMITDKESIERIQSMIDYTQSISYMPKGYICEECGMDGNSDDCAHYPGQIIKDKNGKERRVIFTTIPNYAAELSFVLVPGYRNARVVAMEQNNAGGVPITGVKAISYYNKKVQEVVNFDNKEVVQEISTAETINENLDTNKTHDTINNEFGIQEGPEMEKLLEAFSNLATQIAEQNKLSSEVLATLKSKETSTVVATETAATQTTETTVATQTTEKVENSTSEDMKALSALVSSLVEQNKAILDKLEANKVTTQEVTQEQTTTTETSETTVENTSTEGKETQVAAGTAEANAISQDGAGNIETTPKKVVINSYAKTISGQL